MKFFLATYIEPLSFLIYLGATILLLSKAFYSNRVRILVVNYFIAGLLMLTAAVINGHISNLFLYNFLYLVTGVCLSRFFFLTFKSSFKKRLALAAGLVIVSYYLFSNIYFGFDQFFDSIGYALSSCCIVILIFLFFHELMKNVNLEPLSLNFNFWFAASQLIYHLGAFAIFLTYGYFTYKVLPAESYTIENRAVLTDLWIVHNVVLFLGSLIVLAGSIWIVYKGKSHPRVGIT